MKTITASRKYVNSRGRNVTKLEIKLADGNNTWRIKKPFIVVEDFDSGLLGKENGYEHDDRHQLGKLQHSLMRVQNSLFEQY